MNNINLVFPTYSFQSTLQEILENQRKEIRGIYSNDKFKDAIKLNIEYPKFNFDSLKISNILSDYFEENKLSNVLQESIKRNLKNLNIQFDYHSDESVIKISNPKVSTYTDLDRMTYVEMPTPKVWDAETIFEHDSKVDDNDLNANDEPIIKDFTPLIDFLQTANNSFAEINIKYFYPLSFTGYVSFEFIALIFSLHFIFAYLLVEIERIQKKQLNEQDKE